MHAIDHETQMANMYFCLQMIFTKIRNRNKAREEFEKFISKSVEILAEDEMKMNIHKDKMLWYNTKYCIRTSDERS